MLHNNRRYQMTRGIYTKWIVGGIVLLIIVAGVCLLWYRHDTAAGRKAAVEAEKVLQQWEAEKQKQTITAETESTQTPAESITPTAEKPITGKTGTKPLSNGAEGPEVEAQQQSDVQVSPYGFGPYPEVPEDYPSKVDWTLRNSPNAELLTRVLIKLWTDGEKNFRGGGTYNGKIYPWYHNTIYVKFIYAKNADGEIIGSSSMKMSGPRVDRSVVKDWSTPPSHIRILEIDSSGIDPYQYLNLR